MDRQQEWALFPCQVAVPEGVSKEDAQAEATDRFNEINLLLSNLANKFSNNLMDSTAAFKRLITDKDDMAGLPDSFLGQAAQQVELFMRLQFSRCMLCGCTRVCSPWHSRPIIFKGNSRLGTE
jgi:Zn-dependent oligopeptidase